MPLIINLLSEAGADMDTGTCYGVDLTALPCCNSPLSSWLSRPRWICPPWSGASSSRRAGRGSSAPPDIASCAAGSTGSQWTSGTSGRSRASSPAWRGSEPDGLSSTCWTWAAVCWILTALRDEMSWVLWCLYLGYRRSYLWTINLHNNIC